VKYKKKTTWFVSHRIYDDNRAAPLAVTQTSAMPRPTNPDETIAFRLTEILRRLNEGEKLDPHALAQYFGVTLRTIQRDLNERFAFLELEKKEGLYSVNRMRLGMLSLKDVQRFAGLAGLQGLYPRLSTDFLKEILDASLQSALLIRGPHYEDMDGKELAFNQLKQAIRQNHAVSFDYMKPDGIKRVEAAQPYKLVNQEGVWYLAATDRGQIKSYAFSKIDRLLVSPDTFAPDAALHALLAAEDSVWLNQKKTEVVLKVAEPAAGYFQRRKLIGGQKIIKELEAGGLIISGLIAHPDQILPIVRQWIPCIRIISPTALQTQLENQLRGYLVDE
jgi:predicted DNA-binding transcriptional regulator YafY